MAAKEKESRAQGKSNYVAVLDKKKGEVGIRPQLKWKKRTIS